MPESGRAGLEGPARPGTGLGKQRFEIAHTMPPQAAIRTRPRDIRVQERPRHRQKSVERQQKKTAQRDNHRLLGDRQPSTGKRSTGSFPVPSRSADCAGWPNGPERCHAASTCAPSPRSPRSAAPELRRVHRSPTAAAGCPGSSSRSWAMRSSCRLHRLGISLPPRDQIAQCRPSDEQ